MFNMVHCFTNSPFPANKNSPNQPPASEGSEASAEAPKTALPASRDMAMPKTATLKTPKMMGNPAPLRSGSNLSVTLPLLGAVFFVSRFFENSETWPMAERLKLFGTTY